MKLRKLLGALCAAALCLALSLPAAAAEAAAAAPDPAAFTDAAAIEHWDAVAALTQLGVITGRDDGAFHPADPVTRAEAAKMISTILNGGKDAPEAGTETGFSDVQKHWAKPYIEDCAQRGILSGRGDGSFDPDGEVSKFELFKMAEVMLGYDAETFHLSGPTWWLAAHDRATRTGLYDDLPEFPHGEGLAVSDETLTRDSAAQILYNALRGAPFVGVTSQPAEGGGVQFVYEYAKRPDGADADLLWTCFGLDGVEDLPAQPGKE